MTREQIHQKIADIARWFNGAVTTGPDPAAIQQQHTAIIGERKRLAELLQVAEDWIPWYTFFTGDDYRARGQTPPPTPYDFDRVEIMYETAPEKVMVIEPQKLAPETNVWGMFWRPIGGRRRSLNSE